MGDLKPGWKRVKFGDVVRLNKEKSKDPEADGLERYVGLEHIEPGDLRVQSWGDVADGTTFTNRFRPGQVLFGKRRAYQRKVAVADFDGVCSGDIYILEPRDPHVLVPELLPFICQTDAFFEHAVGTSAGSLSPRTNWKSLAEYEFVLPAPQDQERVLGLLASANAVASATTDALLAIEDAKDAAIARALQCGLENAKREMTPLGERPAHWETCEIRKRYDVQLGKMLSKKTRGPGIRRPYLRNANVDWGRFDLDDVAEMSLTEAEIPRYALKPGDILACEGRHVGKSAIWKGQIAGACYQKALHRLRPRSSEKDLPEFMLYVLRYYSVSGRLIRHTTGTTIPHLPLANLRSIQVAFPPRHEQEEIVSFVEGFERGAESLRHRLLEAKVLISNAATVFQVTE